MFGWLSAASVLASRVKRDAIGIQRERLGQHLNRDRAIELRVSRALDLAHAAGAERADHFIWTEASTCAQRQGVASGFLTWRGVSLMAGVDRTVLHSRIAIQDRHSEPGTRNDKGITPSPIGRFTRGRPLTPVKRNATPPRVTIRGIAHKGLRRLYEDGVASGIGAGTRVAISTWRTTTDEREARAGTGTVAAGAGETTWRWRIRSIPGIS
jgi:hypothetical protein